MAVVSFPTIMHSIGQLSYSLSTISQAITTSYNLSSRRNLHNKRAHVFYCYHSQFSCQPLTLTSFSLRHKGLSPVPLNAKSSEPGEEDSRALETVLRLYAAIKNKNIRELSDVIGEECHCLCNFFSRFQPFQGKKQVLDFFSYLISSLGNNIEFVVTPTMHDGMNVGIKWNLEWKKTHVPLGKGFSFYICHVYKGKVVIRNVEMFLEPLLHIEPFRLVTIGFMTTLIDKISSNPILKDKPKTALHILLTVLIIAALLCYFKHDLVYSILDFLYHKKD